MILNVRVARKADVGGISRLNSVVQEKHATAAPWLFKETEIDPTSMSSLIEKKDTIMYVADVEGTLAGYIFAQERHYPDTPLTFAYVALHVHHICVDAKFRRQGIGSALIDAVREAASQRGARRLTVDVWEFNEEAKRMFEGAGLFPFQQRFWQALDL